MVHTQVSPVRVDARGWGWRHAGRRRWAVDNVDLMIAPGERVLLLGASGAGKSTLLAGLAGVLGGDDEGESHGDLLLDGRPASERRGTIGLVLQDPDSQTIMARIGDDVAFGCENLGVPRDQIWLRVREALREVGLDQPLTHPSAALSGGQRQRLALAGVLAMQPGLILLDEPTANLDPRGVIEVRDAVARVAERTTSTLIVVEHRVDVWLPVVDRIIVIGPEGILADGAPDHVLDQSAGILRQLGIWMPGAVTPTSLRTAATGSTLIRPRGLAVGRRGGPIIVAPRDLRIDEGTITGLVGPNGSGKTTIALTLAGLIAPANGGVGATVELAGALGAEPHRWRSRELLGRIGMVFQDPEHQFIEPTVRREIAAGPKAAGMTETSASAIGDALMGRLQLDHLADANPFTLSGGEKRRLSVATALVTAPRVLLLDEPTFGQDARTWRELVDLLDDRRAGGTAIVMATHDLALLAAVADVEVEMTAEPEVVAP